MQFVVEFVGSFIRDVREQWLRADPLLMGAAIAYNSLFALVPLAVAFVSMVSLFDVSGTVLVTVTDLIETALPPEIAAFVLEIVGDSSSAVATQSPVVLTISLLVALWAGSRAVYAVQKSLRLIEGSTDERGYLVTRLTGIIVTVGAGVSVLVGYSFLLFGEALIKDFELSSSGATAALTQIAFWVVGALWIYGLLWVVYRFGPPRPVDHAMSVAGVTEVVLVSGSWFAFTLLPSNTTSIAATFGVIGVMLVLLYFVGVAMVGSPIFVTATWNAWTVASGRYDSDGEQDEVDAGESDGPQERSETPRETPR